MVAYGHFATRRALVIALFAVAFGGGAFFVLGGHGSSAPGGSHAAVIERPAYVAVRDRFTFVPARLREADDGTSLVVTGAIGGTAMERASSLMILPRHERWTFLARESSIALPVVHGETSAAGLEAAPVSSLTVPILVLAATVPTSAQVREALPLAAAEPVSFPIEETTAGIVEPGVTIDTTLAPLDVPLAAMVPASAGLPEAPVTLEAPNLEGEARPVEKAVEGQRTRVPRTPGGAAEEKAPKPTARTQSKSEGAARSRLTPPSTPSPAPKADPEWWPFESVNGR